MYISTSRTMGTPNRRRTGPHLSPPQALMVETSRLVCALDLRRAQKNLDLNISDLMRR